MNLRKLIHNVISEYINEENDYRGVHQAPNKEYGSPLYDLTDMYPDDIYGHNATRYYGDNSGGYSDDTTINIIQSARNKPNFKLKIYRAVPDINKPISNKIKELNRIISYNNKYNFFPSKNQIVWDLQDKYDTDKYEYDEQKKLILNDIDKQIEELTLQLKERIKINKGDWVTINKEYAKEHGISHLNNIYKILVKTVSAKELFTDGNSIHEWGYDN